MTSSAPRLALIGAAVLAACGTHEEGIIVQVGLRHEPGAAAGVDRAHLAVAEIELLECEDLLGLFRGMILGVAHAHGVTTPTSLAVPAVHDLAAAPYRQAIGELRPPPGRYCGIAVELGPADGDALGMPEDRAMVGRTLQVEASTRDAGGDLEPVTASSSRRVRVEVTLQDVLRLEDRDSAATIDVLLSLGDAAEGLDLGDPRAGEVLLDGAMTSIGADARTMP